MGKIRIVTKKNQSKQITLVTGAPNDAFQISTSFHLLYICVSCFLFLSFLTNPMAVLTISSWFLSLLYCLTFVILFPKFNSSISNMCSVNYYKVYIKGQFHQTVTVPSKLTEPVNLTKILLIMSLQHLTDSQLDINLTGYQHSVN